MANRRMLSKKICDTDAFLDMPLSAQALYLHLVLNADDDGFVGNPKKISRVIGARDDDMKILFGKKFIIGFHSGVVVVKHWKIHNLIRSDRYVETTYIKEKAQLELKSNRAYTLTEPLKVNVIPNDNQMEPQYSIVEDSIVEVKKDIVDYKSYMNFFNTLENLPNVIKLSDKRKRHLKSRLNDYTDEELKELWELANNTPFLCGNNDRKWKADFDWLINDNNLIKLKEGKYKSVISKSTKSDEELRAKYG